MLQEVISPIQNKVGQFLSSALIRNIVGQTVSSFDVRKIMDERKILIMNLSKGRLGEDNSALLGAMMITKIQLAAMGRVDIPEETRADFYLYVDEFQNFATESFANILSEARKYHLNLILANQYVTQIDEKVRDAIFGNAGSIISFRVGAMDAEFLEKEFEPVFMMNDIVNLAKYQIYLKLMIDGIAGDAFSATTLPPIKLETADNEQKIIDASRERYTSKKDEVEEKIRRWSGMLSAEECQALIQPRSPAPAPTPAARPKEPARSQVATPAPARPKLTPTPVAPRPQQSGEGRYAAPKASVAPPVPKASAPIAPKAAPLQKEEAYSLKQASAVLQSALAEQSAPAPVSPKADFVPPLAPKKEPMISLDEFEKEEGRQRARGEEKKEPEVQEVRESVETEVAAEVPEKKLYQAQCATCGTDIEVPFEPDGTRPTFCKDCLRDYQRATAKARNEIERKNQTTGTGGASGNAGNAPRQDVSGRRDALRDRVVSHRSYTSSERPLSLAQVQHIEPKKFKALRKRPELNLSEVRALIDDTRRNNP